jgi:hypothetical protein
VSVFPAPFGVPALACCVIPSPLRTSALLTVGPPSQLGLDLNGITAFRRYETRSGWASPLSRGGGVLPTGRASPVGACRFPAASPSPSLPQPVGEGSSDETSTEIHTINPSDLSLARGPRTEREPLRRFPRASHPAVTSLVSSGECTSAPPGLTWDPREGSHRALRAAQGVPDARGQLTSPRPRSSRVAMTV